MGKPVVIVESPAKARTIGTFLGAPYVVTASLGHVRDLPESAAEIPARYKGQSWARLGVDVDNGFKPLYVVPADKREQVKRLKDLVDGADALYLATDEDREGESISWHLLEVLAPRCPVHRLAFHEITREAIARAFDSPRQVDTRLVQAQEARRVLDRLVGYEVSPLLWKKVRPRLSAGRVQSVAVRLLVERERERMAFHAAVFWGLKATFAAEGGTFGATLAAVGGHAVAARNDFDPATGQLKPRIRARLLDEPSARAVLARVEGRPGRVAEIEERPFREAAPAPFITSTLQQEANRRFRWSARRAMQVAQRLYDTGWITYMRTDSTVLSREAIAASRTVIAETFGPALLPSRPRTHRSTSRLAQEAHEAIRPAGSSFRSPAEAARELDDDGSRLYDLVWRRTVASQMPDAEGLRVRVAIDVEDARFQAFGRTFPVPGFRRAYVDTAEENGREEGTSLVPPVVQGQEVRLATVEATRHETQPPSRLTEASLVKELETRGIGRPSTYASIIETIQTRGYVFKKGHTLVPTFTALAVTDLLSGALAHLVDYDFTARMEGDLDAIALGRRDPTAWLRAFWAGEGTPGLREQVRQATGSVDARAVCSLPVPRADADLAGLVVRVGRFGAYLAVGDARIDVPDDLPPDELDGARVRALLAERSAWPRRLGHDPASGEEILVQDGRFGPYVQVGENGANGDARPRRVSVPKGLDARAIGLSEALGLLALPRALGPHPASGEPVVVSTGRFGPFVRSGEETRSLPDGSRVLDLSLDEAVAILASRTRKGAKRDAGRVLGAHPASGAEVRVLAGRFGPYVTDGTVNATLPRSQDPDAVTLADALVLLEARRGRPTRPRRGGRRQVRT